MGVNRDTYNPTRTCGTMQYQWTHVADGAQHLWVLKRNCAMSPRQLAGCLAIVGAVSLGIATVFALHGAWPVIPFACLEIAALSVAFVVYGRHAADYEKIVVRPGGVVVERADGASLHRVELGRTWLRVEYKGRQRELIRLVAGGQVHDVGRFVPDERRDALARELKSTLASLQQG